MPDLIFKKLGLSQVEAEAQAGSKSKDKTIRTMVAMHETAASEDADLATLEGIIGKLPQDYRDFLKKQNGGIPSRPLLKTRDNERVVEAFLALKAPDGFYDSIGNIREVYTNRLPRDTLPTALAGGGDLILLNTDPSKVGEILYWITTSNQRTRMPATF